MAEVVDIPERRSWLSHGLAGLMVASLGIAGVASISLLPSQTLSASGSSLVAPDLRSTGTVPAAFDSAQQVLRSDLSSGTGSGALLRSQQLTRSYQLAVSLQATSTLSSSLRLAERRTALEAGAMTIAQAQERLVGAEQQREIQQQVAADMAIKAAQYLAEAQAEAAAAQEQQAAAAASSNTTGAFVPVSGTTLGTAGNASVGNTSTRTAAAGSAGSSALGPVVSPITSAAIGAYFGETGSLWARYHTGLDFHAPMGEPVHAAAGGTVVVVAPVGTGRDTWAGNHVAIQHAGGLTTMYSHLSVIDVKAGQHVNAGDVIGLVGSTGHVTGPHLHFELYPAGVRPGSVYQAIDPQAWLASHGVQVRRTN